MDYSAASEYDNVSINQECSESVLYQAINNVLSSTTTYGNKIFCPLCVRTYEFRFVLLDHLKHTHLNFLCRTSGKSFIFDQCPFCSANFFGRHTVIKHVLQTHSNIIGELYLQVGDDAALRKCFFCTEFYRKKFVSIFISHIEQRHFLQFTELFEDQFMTIDDSFLSPKSGVCIRPLKAVIGNLSGDTKRHEIENCFDFSRLKEQLYNVEDNEDGLKSILKCRRTKLNEPSPTKKTKLCRVLQFDVPDENKENSVLPVNIKSVKQITYLDDIPLCNNDLKQEIRFFNNIVDGSPVMGIKPLHCSTPKSCLNVNNEQSFISADSNKVKLSKANKKLKIQKKPTFKSYFYKKEYFYQCGKCKKLFQENLELNCHIKKSHKLFILNLLHPCYQCAICKAKFFKNYYLKKHIMLHSMCKESSSRLSI